MKTHYLMAPRSVAMKRIPVLGLLSPTVEEKPTEIGKKKTITSGVSVPTLMYLHSKRKRDTLTPRRHDDGQVCRLYNCGSVASRRRLHTLASGRHRLDKWTSTAGR